MSSSDIVKSPIEYKGKTDLIVIKEGWLQKRSRTLGHYRKRWMVLYKNKEKQVTLSSYKHKQVYNSATETIKVSKIIKVLRSNHNKLEFVLNQHSTEFVLRATEESFVLEWINTFKQILNDNNNKKNNKNLNNKQISVNIRDIQNTNNNSLNHLNDINIKYNELKTKYDLLLIENDKRDNNIIKLKNDLAIAQKSILSMTNIVGINQILPTVQDTLLIFHNIRDQQHHNSISKFKIYFKNKYNNYQKYYINQIIHQIVFNTLIECYNAIKIYKYNIYNNIADELNMKYTMRLSKFKDNNQDDDHKDNDKIIEESVFRIISNRFGSYFKMHYKYILKLDKILNELLDKLLNDIYKKELFELNIKNNDNDDILKTFRGYVSSCLEVCWIMLLQEPELDIYPKIWKSDQNNNKYDNSLHKRVLGSDRKCEKILYFVWPIISRKNVPLQDQKMDVVTKNELYDTDKYTSPDLIVDDT